MKEKDMEKDFIDLFEFQTRLKEGVECLFSSHLWLRAEVSAVKARPGGHCYLELSQSKGNSLVAKANAIIWSSRYRLISPYFEAVTGSPLQAGMVILVRVQVNYSQLYGFSLIIDDIDPEYSLGQQQLQLQLAIERLTREGLMDLQKELALPALPRRLAVISAEDAAGYRDFMRHLHENPYGFAFETELYPALMQGAGCPESIIAALDAVLGSGVGYDAVLLLRGGGARLDLACFDDYDLSAVIAQYPLPVLTAIGHDQDHHLCDMVAHVSVKTPTALADYMIGIYEDEDAGISSLATRIRLALAGKVSVAEAGVSMLEARVRNGFLMKVTAMEAALSVLQTRIKASDPRRMLERGYVLALSGDGVVMKGAAGAKAGDRVSVMFADGVLGCTVADVKVSGNA